MTKEFLAKVMREVILDTRKYRYYAKDTGHGIIVTRCPIDWLGTTAALEPWEIVYDGRKD